MRRPKTRNGKEHGIYRARAGARRRNDDAERCALIGRSLSKTETKRCSRRHRSRSFPAQPRLEAAHRLREASLRTAALSASEIKD